MNEHRRRGFFLGMLGVVAVAGGVLWRRSKAVSAALPPAVPADRQSLDLPGFGQLSYYADAGASGRPLLLLHSVNAAASAYEVWPLFVAYRGQRPVYALEWPGFGSGDRPDVAYTPELMGRALTRMLGVTGPDTDVVALSLGSEFATRVALSDSRIRSLAFISPTGLGSAKGPTQTAAAEQKADELYRKLSSPLWADALFGLIASRPSIQWFLSRSFQGAPDPGLVAYSFATSHQPGARYAPLYFISGGLFSPDAFGELYSKLRQPALVLYDRDAFVTFDRLPELTGKNANVKGVKITPTKGLPQFEQPEKVTAALNAFWQGLD